MSFTTLISTADLAAHLNTSNWVVLDCRFAITDTEKGRQAYKASHIAGARYAHLDEDLSGEIIPGTTGRHPLPLIDDFVAQLGHWGITNNAQVIAYDDMGGPFAARLWWMLKWLGHENVAVLDGGWPMWLADGFPVNDAIPAIHAETYVPNLQTALLADVSAVEDATHDGATCLIDARATARFEGKEEPLDPVAGHIPSAQSFPWQANLDEQKRFLKPSLLKARFEGIDTSRCISYCGSGVTAAHNLLAIAHAGLPLPKLYAGSWSHWITNPDRPIG